MGTYRVMPGHRLAHHGAVLEEGAVVELPDHVAADMAVSQHVEDAAPRQKSVLPVIADRQRRQKPEAEAEVDPAAKTAQQE